VRNPTGAERPTTRTIHFRACDLKMAVECGRVLVPAVINVVKPFRITGRGNYFLRLGVDSYIQDPNELRCVSSSRHRLTVHVGNAKPEPVAGAIGCLLSQLLIENNGLLLHGAFLLHDGFAHVFVGKPGAGKSTIVRNAPGLHVVHEEKVAVRLRRGKWWAYGVPLLDNGGNTGKNAVAPLAALYLIEKSDSLQKSPVGRRGALLQMPFHVVLPLNDTESRRKAFENLFSLVDGVSLWRLRFRKDSDVSSVI
jgi:hypothetical protein